MTLYLGVDGGGSGCRAAVADEARVLGLGEAGPANIASDPDGAAVNILHAARAALASAGLWDAGLHDLHAGLGLAGANAAGRGAMLRSALPFATMRIETDALTALKGALEDADGVVAAIGTGSVFGSQRLGVVRQIGGWGLRLGDEGGGAWIGRALLARALRAEDGFVARTPLLDALLAEHGGPLGVVAFSLGATPADYAALAPRAVASDDPAAVAVMDAAEAEVGAAVDLLRGGDDLPVVFLGGLGPEFARRLGGRVRVETARGSALDGAVRLAREGA